MILKRIKKWVGIPAPKKIKHDDWFPVPEELKETEQVEFKEDIIIGEIPNVPKIPTPIEPKKMHEWAYRQATQNSSTTLDLDPPGGSENIWESGVG